MKDTHHLYQRKETGNYYFQHKDTKKINLKTKELDVAKKRRDQLLAKLELGIFEEETVVPIFWDVATEWFKRKKGKCRESTLQRYKDMLNGRVKKSNLARMRVDRITDLDVEDFWQAMKLSPTTTNNYLSMLSGIFTLAMKRKYITTNPVTTADRPKGDPKEPEPLSVDEVERFLEAVNSHYRDYFEVAFFTGLRHCEMTALRWVNVDLKNGIIKVRESKVLGVIGPPKNKWSSRDIKVVPRVLNALKRQKLKTGGRGCVFLNQEGRPCRLEIMRNNCWKNGLKKAGIRWFTMKNTRHTCLTRMLMDGERPMYVAKYAGHRGLNMLNRHYAGYLQSPEDGVKFAQSTTVLPHTDLKVV